MESPDKRKKLKKSRTSFLVNLNSDEAVSSLTAKHTKRYLANRYSILNIKFSDLGKSTEQLVDVDEGEVLSESESEANPFGSVAKYNRLGWRIDAKNENNVGASEDKSFKFDANDIRKLALEGPLLSKVKDLGDSNKHQFYNQFWHRDHQESLTLNSRDKLSRAGAVVANKMRALEMFDRHILARKSLSDRWSTLPKVFEENAFTPLRQVSLSRPSSKESSPTKSDSTPSSGSSDDRGEAPTQEDDNLNIFEPSMRTSFVENQLSSFESDAFFLSFEDQDVRNIGSKAVTEAETKKSKEAAAVSFQDETKRNESKEKQAVMNAPPAAVAQPVVQVEAGPITQVQRDNSSNDGSSTTAASVTNSSSEKGEAEAHSVQVQPEAPEVRVIQLDDSLDISSQFEALQTEFEYQVEQERRAQTAAAEARDALGVITISFKPADIFPSLETQPTLIEPQELVPAKLDFPVSTALKGYHEEQNDADQSSFPPACQESIYVSDFVLTAASTAQPYKIKKIDSNEKDDFAFVEQNPRPYDSDVSLD